MSPDAKQCSQCAHASPERAYGLRFCRLWGTACVWARTDEDRCGDGAEFFKQGGDDETQRSD